MTLTFTPRFECVDIQPSASVALLPADASEKDATSWPKNWAKFSPL